MVEKTMEFEDFSEEQFDYLTEQMQAKNFSKGQILFDQGDSRERFTTLFPDLSVQNG